MSSWRIARGQLRSMRALTGITVAAVSLSLSCADPSAPPSPPRTVAPPTNVSAVLVSPTSARISWTDGAGSDPTKSYNILRDGVKLAEVSTTSYLDNGLNELTTYRYAVSANGQSGQVSATSAEAPPLVAPDVTAPTVVSTSPTNGASGVALLTTVRATFSESMNATTLDAATFTVSAGGSVAGTVSFDPGTRTATFTPTSALTPSTTYTATITTGAKDVSGNALALNIVFAFTTAAAVDVSPPSVVATSPVNGATNISVNALVKVTFSEAMNASSVNGLTFTLSSSGGAIAGSVSYDASTLTATFTPTNNLPTSQTYTATVSTGAKDIAGNSLASNFVFTFTTAAPVDATPPTVVASVPANGSTNVAVNTQVKVTLSEAMNVSTVNGSTFTLSTSSGPVAGAVSYDASTFVATFTPSSNLLNSQTYTATLSTGARDAAGNSLASNFVFSFTTAAAIDATPPTIIANVPANGATNVAVNTPVSVTFSEPIDASTINSSTFQVTVAGVPASGSVGYNATTRIATFAPAGGILAAGQSYSVTVTTGVKDVAGNSMAANFTFAFTTAAPQDATPPTIVSRSPSPGATNVDPATSIQVGFSEALNASTVNASTFSVAVSGSPIAGVVSYDSNTRIAKFTPSAPLGAGLTFTVTTTTGVRDAAGNALASNDVFTFSTFAAIQNLAGEPIFQTTTNNPTSGQDELHIHIRFTQNGTNLSLDPACTSGQCVMLARNQAGANIIGPDSPGEAWVNISSITGTINSAGQVTFTITNANSRTFTFNGTASNSNTLTGTLAGPTQPSIAAVFVRSP